MAKREEVAAALKRTHDADPEGLKQAVSASKPWRDFYRRGVVASDLLVLVLASLGAEFFRFGFGSTVEAVGPININYTTLGVAVTIMWWLSLQFSQAHDHRILGGQDFAEYSRIIRATVVTFGGLAVLSVMLKWDMSRGFLALALPLGLTGLLVERKLWRVWLRRHRRRGNHISNVLIIGGQQSAREIAASFAQHPDAGVRVSGVWVPDEESLSGNWLRVLDQDIPVLGTNQTLDDALAATGADTIIVTDTEHIGHHGLRELTWQLSGVDVELMVSPNVMDVAGSRLRLKAVGSMPFIHLEEPQYAEAGSWQKVWFDKAGAALAFVLALPVLLGAALAIKLTSRGPILYRQSRIGLDGKPFDMLKFRSMHVDADAKLATLLAEQGSAETPLFKIDNDPRITPIGRFLRRYSIDELPQLWSVMRGDMSLVGPRPQRPAEVNLYRANDFRRLHVRPGMTGLWQVSGRSDLDWEDAIKLDTYYVENWSMTGDLIILSRTVRAVIGSGGAH